MCGVDLFDAQVKSYDLGKKTMKWTNRVVDFMITYSLINARAAFAVKNERRMPDYSIRDFVEEILREAFKSVEEVTSIRTFIGKKPKQDARSTCNWPDCKKKSKEICQNTLCKI